MHCHGFFRGILFTVIDAIVACGVANLMIVQCVCVCVCVCVRACVLAVIGSMYLWGALLYCHCIPFSTGADPKAESHNGRTPVMVACKNGHREVANLLLGHGEQLQYCHVWQFLVYWQVLKHCFCKQPVCIPVVGLHSSIIVFMSCEWIATGINEYNFMY